MKSVLLKSRTTGEKKAFPNIVQAAKFIGHNDSYIHNMHKQGKCLNSKFTGEQYDVFVGLDEIAIEDYIPDEYTGKRHMQPCGECLKFAYGCEWSESFKPVPGWKAIPTVTDTGAGQKPIKSYKILYCPKFERG